MLNSTCFMTFTSFSLYCHFHPDCNNTLLHGNIVAVEYIQDPAFFYVSKRISYVFLAVTSFTG